jgi:hypothetical protein
MFRWVSLTRKTKKPLPARPRRVTLQLESLETRDCPSASSLILPVVPDPALSIPAIVGVSNQGLSLTLTATPGPAGTAMVSGQVTGPAAGGLTVTFTGVVSGSVTTNADGTFTFSGQASGLGQVQATVTDGAGNTVSSAVSLSAPTPTIVNFRVVNDGNGRWTFTGQVQGANTAGLVVSLAGIPALDNNNASATVQANGTFSCTVNLQPGECGGVTADCIDWWGQASNEATTYVLG